MLLLPVLDSQCIFHISEQWLLSETPGAALCWGCALVDLACVVFNALCSWYSLSLPYAPEMDFGVFGIVVVAPYHGTRSSVIGDGEIKCPRNSLFPLVKGTLSLRQHPYFTEVFTVVFFSFFSIDRLLHSVGYKLGFALDKPKIANPIDLAFVVFQSVSAVWDLSLPGIREAIHLPCTMC